MTVHCPLGPIALAASLQVGFTTPNLLIQEQSLGIHDIDIDETALTRAAQTGHRWRNPIWRRDDGSLCEW